MSLEPRRRGAITVAVHLLTWDYAVLAVEEPGSEARFVPRSATDVEAFLDRVERGDEDAWLRRVTSRRASRVLRRVPRRYRAVPQPSVGIEHEYTVLEAGRPVDFGRLIDWLGLPGLRADPVDPNARRGDWGGVITADGIEAEVATPPIPIGAGAIDQVVGSAAAGRSFLEAHLGPDRVLEGYSTHLNVSIPLRGDLRTAERYVEVFAPALMLLLDQQDSPGLLVRPRPGRLELCGDYAEADRLAVAATFAVASTLAARRGGRAVRALRLDPDVVPSRQRYGYHLAPTAYGDDLYQRGRSARLRRAGGRVVSADEHLAACWTACRRLAVEHLGIDEAQAVEQVVCSNRPLPSARA